MANLLNYNPQGLLGQVDLQGALEAQRRAQMQHNPQTPYAPAIPAREALRSWAQGVGERSSPQGMLSALAGEVNKYKGMPANELVGQFGPSGGSLSGLIGGLYNTTGLINRGRELIQGEAESLAKRLKDAGVEYKLQHSGSAAGPSSYIKVVGMPDIRFSGHSKGVLGSQGVINVSTQDEINAVYNQAVSNQKQLNNQLKSMSAEYEKGAIEARLKSADKKIAKGKQLTISEQEAMDWRNQKNAQPTGQVPWGQGLLNPNKPQGILGQ